MKVDTAESWTGRSVELENVLEDETSIVGAKPACADEPVVSLENLSVSFNKQAAVRNVSLSVSRGEVVGILGESGCGKSVTWLAAMGLLPASAIVTGQVHIAGEKLLGAAPAVFDSVRGRRVAMIFQDPSSSLNPVRTIGSQIAEVLTLHRGLGRRAARHEAKRLLDRVEIPDAAQRMNAYPHELSGGQNQRVMIAIALAGEPDLLIADEPTTALDVTIQAQILELIRTIQRESQMAVVLISHDVSVISDLCDRVLVMYAGQVIEEAAAERLLSTPQHPYTKALLASVPSMREPKARLQTLSGAVPQLTAEFRGCAFASRCSKRLAPCGQRSPELQHVGEVNGNTHLVACVRAEQMVKQFAEAS